MVSTAQQESQFHTSVRERFGKHTGKQIADSAVRELRLMGIEPEELQPAASGTSNNTMIFSVGNLAVKLVTNVEGFHESVTDKVKLKPLVAVNVGFDMGNAPIALVVTPLMSTKGVTTQHVKALCHELDKSGKLFRDNKTDNIALTRAGLPYVIDDGAVMLRSQLSPLERGMPPTSTLPIAAMIPARKHGTKKRPRIISAGRRTRWILPNSVRLRPTLWSARGKWRDYPPSKNSLYTALEWLFPVTKHSFEQDAKTGYHEL